MKRNMQQLEHFHKRKKREVSRNISKYDYLSPIENRKKVKKNERDDFDQSIFQYTDYHCFLKNKDHDCTSMLYNALDNENCKLIESLIDQGVDLNVVKPDRNPFFFEFMTSTKASYRENVSLAQKMISAGADINIHATRMNDRTSLLYECIYKRNERMVRLLIENGANINPPCPDEKCYECSPLSIAIKTGMDNIINLLIEKGSDVNSLNCKKMLTPLHAAVKWNRIKWVDRLLNLGADINAVDYTNKTPLIAAVKENRPKIVELLLQNLLLHFNFPSNFFVLFYASELNLKCIEAVLNANPDVNFVDSGNKLAVERYASLPSQKPAINQIKNHLVKLRAAGFYLCDGNLAAVSGKKHSKFFTKCCEEIESMKNTTISCSSHVNFYDVLSMRDEKLALCLESLDDSGILQSGFDKKFTSYAGMITYKLKKAYQWVELREAVRTSVNVLFNNYLPTTIMEKLFSYFSLKELVELHRHFEKKDPRENDDYLF